MSAIILKNVTKQFTTKALGTITAVSDLNLTVEQGECFSFLGPSGCGKTTTLRMIAGFEDPTQGEIYLSGEPVSINGKGKSVHVPPERRGLGMVFQSFAVWPHLNIFDNVAFPLQVQKVNKAEIQKRVKEALHHTSLSGLERMYPSDLSGGQQQRIALARSIVTNPKIMLLDEPLSNLDPKLRETMRFEIRELQKKLNFTIIFVTHDQAEAMAMSDRMMVMDMGHIVQIGTPTELYNNPSTRFVHNFLGQSNFTEVVIKDGKVYPKGDLSRPIEADTSKVKDKEMIFATRPNEIQINKESGYKTEIVERDFLVSTIDYKVRIGDQLVQVQTDHRTDFAVGEECYVKFLNPMWYKAGEDSSEAERNKRQIV